MHNKRHPAEDIIAMAAADMSLIGEDEKVHIESCPECADKLSRLMSALENLGVFANRGTPRMTSPIRLEHKTSRQVPGWLWGTALGASLCAALVLILLNVQGRWQTRLYLPAPQAVYEERHPEDNLISDVGMLVENPLPENWSSLNYGDESVMDADVMEFMAPEDDSPVQETM
jgi:hypothetical protein